MKTLRILTAASAVAFLGAAASAATLTQVFEPDPSVAATATALFNQFDASLGTLTGVTLEMSAGFETRWSAKRTEDSQGKVYLIRGFFSDSYIQFSGDVFDDLESEVDDGEVGPLEPTEVDEVLYSDSIKRFYSVTLSSPNGLPLEDFIGTGQLSVLLGVFNTMDHYGIFGGWSAAGNGSFGMKTDYTMSASLSYDYTPSPVPLPAAGWLLLAGVGGLAAAARRRKSARA